MFVCLDVCYAIFLVRRRVGMHSKICRRVKRAHQVQPHAVSRAFRKLREHFCYDMLMLCLLCLYDEIIPAQDVTHPVSFRTSWTEIFPSWASIGGTSVAVAFIHVCNPVLRWPPAMHVARRPGVVCRPGPLQDFASDLDIVSSTSCVVLPLRELTGATLLSV